MLTGKKNRYFAVLISAILGSAISSVSASPKCIESENTADAVICLERKIAILAEENALLKKSLSEVLIKLDTAAEQPKTFVGTQSNWAKTNSIGQADQAKSVYDYKVYLKGAYREQDRVILEFLFYNTLDSLGGKLKWYRSVSSDRETVAYDSEGNTFVPYEITLGKDSTKSSSTSVTDIPANTPVKGTVVFKDIPLTTGSLHAIKLTFSDGSYGNTEVINFSNVEILDR